METRVTSKELFKSMNEIHKAAMRGIVTLMKSHDCKCANFLVDQNGNGPDDDGFDEDYERENRVWAKCYDGYYGTTEGYITNVSLDKDYKIVLCAEGETSYSDDEICPETELFLNILERLEMMEEGGLLNNK